uniref:Uncharacterized protein n=1 Tax=Anguilla anguilla TaxID=7936 RepID=A0A0E9W4F1_ANGAN
MRLNWRRHEGLLKLWSSATKNKQMYIYSIRMEKHRCPKRRTVGLKSL